MTSKKTKEPQASQELSQSFGSAKHRVAEISTYEPMTGDQASHLKRLSEEVREPRAFHHRLSRSEASRRIDALIEKLRLGHLPPHTD